MKPSSNYIDHLNVTYQHFQLKCFFCSSSYCLNDSVFLRSIGSSLCNFALTKWNDFLAYSVLIHGSLVKHLLFLVCVLCCCNSKYPWNFSKYPWKFSHISLSKHLRTSLHALVPLALATDWIAIGFSEFPLIIFRQRSWDDVSLFTWVEVNLSCSTPQYVKVGRILESYTTFAEVRSRESLIVAAESIDLSINILHLLPSDLAQNIHQFTEHFITTCTISTQTNKHPPRCISGQGKGPIANISLRFYLVSITSILCLEQHFLTIINHYDFK